jgi:hypothetical protein
MVHFVLDGASQESLARDLDALSLERRSGNRGTASPRHRRTHAGQAQAALRQVLALAVDEEQLRVDENVKLALDIQDDDPFRHTDLRRCEAGAVGSQHGLDHRRANGAHLVVDLANRFRRTAKDRVTELSNVHGFPLHGRSPHYRVVLCMPQENSDPRATVEKILRLEGSTGFRDAAVTCGLEAFIARHCPDEAALAAGSARPPPPE